MKQIVDKLNKIAKKIDESVEIPQTDLIIDSLDAITKAYGGTPNDSNLIVDKLEDIYNNISSGGGGGGMGFVIPEQTISTTASGDVPIQTNFPQVLPTYIILQMIGEAYGQTLHGLVVMSHSYGGGVEEYKANMSFGTSVITINVISLDGGTNWGMNVKVDDVQTAFTGILISAIEEWQTTPV